MMTETKTVTIGRGKVQHTMVLVESGWVDPLTGEEWDVLECPSCGYLQRVQWEPWKTETLRRGEGMLTAEDSRELLELHRSGPAGQLKTRQIMARAPGHSYVRVPTEDQLRQVAREQGREAEFEEMVEEAILKGEPLFTFGMGGAEASTWPEGGGPVKGEVS